MSFEIWKGLGRVSTKSTQPNHSWDLLRENYGWFVVGQMRCVMHAFLM